MLAFASLALAGCGGSVSKTGIELSNLDQKAKREIISISMPAAVGSRLIHSRASTRLTGTLRS